MESKRCVRNRKPLQVSDTMVLLRADTDGGSRVDALIHATASDAEHVLQRARLVKQGRVAGASGNIVAHWALPTMDEHASATRMQAVRTASTDLRRIVGELPNDYGGDSDEDPAVLEIPARRVQMTSVSNLLDDHYRTHEEAQQLLETTKPEKAQELEAVLDELELANIHTARTADFQAQAMIMSIDAIAESIAEEAKKSKRRGGRQGAFKQLPVAETPAADAAAAASQPPTPAADAGSSLPPPSPSALAAPATPGTPDALGALASWPANLGAAAAAEADADSDEEWEEAMARQRQLEAELATAKAQLERMRGSLLALRKQAAPQLKRGEGGRLADATCQTEPMHTEAVQQSLHHMVHEREESLLTVSRQLEAAHKALGVLRAPIAKTKKADRPRYILITP